MNRQQVKVLLEVLKELENRPAIQRVFLDVYANQLCAVVTDGYMLVAYPLGLADDLKELIGQSITDVDLIQWYKLANPKDWLDVPAILEMTERVKAAELYKANSYPKWQTVIPKEPKVTPVLRINPIYLTRVCKIFEEHIKMEFYGEKMAVVLRPSKGGIGLIMPMRDE